MQQNSLSMDAKIMQSFIAISAIMQGPVIIFVVNSPQILQILLRKQSHVWYDPKLV